MSRYIKELALNQPIDVVSMMMEDYIYHNRFSRADWEGEMVFYFKDGHGGNRYMKWSYAGGVLHLEAWLGGKSGRETGLEGMGGASKREFRQSLEDLMHRMLNQRSEDMAGGHVGSDPLHHSSNYAAEHAAWEAKSQAQASQAEGKAGAPSLEPVQEERYVPGGPDVSERSVMLMGIAAVCLALVMPILGVVLGTVTLTKSALLEGPAQKKARGIGIAAVAVGIAMFLGSFLSAFMQIMFW